MDVVAIGKRALDWGKYETNKILHLIPNTVLMVVITWLTSLTGQTGTLGDVIVAAVATVILNVIKQYTLNNSDKKITPTV